MKKTVHFILIFLLFTGLFYSFELFIGGFYGSRSLNDSPIKDIYKNGSTYLFSGGVKHIGMFAEVGFSGFKRDGESTFYKEKSEFKLNDVDFRAGYEYSINNRFYPKAYLGYGSFKYNEDVVSEFLQDTDGTKGGFIFGFGLRVNVYKGLFLEGRVENISLKIKSWDEEVNLGGWRFFVGTSFYLKL